MYLRNFSDENKTKHDIIWTIFTYWYVFSSRLLNKQIYAKLYYVWCHFNQKNVTNVLVKVSSTTNQK